MAHDEDTFTPEEQAQADVVDQQIDARLHAQPFLPSDQRRDPDLLLIQELSRFYRRQAEEIQTHLQRARLRVEQRIAQPQSKRSSLRRLRLLRERQDHMNNPWSWFRASQRSSRLVTLAAAFLLAILAAGLVTGLILVRSHTSTTTHPTPPTTTTAPSPTQPQKPTLVPTQTPSGPVSSGMAYIQMFDANTGWAITEQNNILHTTDGGNHWQDVTPPSIDRPQVPFSPNLTYDFFSPSVAWVASFVRDTSDLNGKTKLFRTTNSGQTWTRTNIQGDIPGQIIFTDSQHGWMFSGTGFAAGSSGADIFRTTNGGATWTKVAVAGPSTADQPGALPFNGDKTGMGALNALTAWATGTQNGPNGFVWLYVTHDGGATWQHQTLPLPSSIDPSTVQVTTNPPTFFNAQDGILPAVFQTPNSLSGDLYVTHDGGATWQGGALIEAAEFDFINANQGWATNGAATGGPILYSTSDGGKHWTKLPSNPNLHAIVVLNFVSAEIGWAIDNPQAQFALSPLTLLKTTDGGKTWTPVPFPNA